MIGSPILLILYNVLPFAPYYKQGVDNMRLESKSGFEVQSADEAAQLENHILAESFNRDSLDYDKVQRQSKELKDVNK